MIYSNQKLMLQNYTIVYTPIDMLGPSGIFSYFFLVIYCIMAFTLICGHATWTTESYQQINKTFKPTIMYNLSEITGI